jgi:signal transduction histidine kinase
MQILPGASRDDEAMRQRIVSAAVVAVIVALVLFAVPLAVVVRSALFSNERLELERAALQAGARVGPEFAAGDPVELPVDRTRTIGIYDLTVRLRAGQGPATGDELVARALSGVVAQTESAGTVAVAVPITSAETVVGVVRAAVPAQAVWFNVVLAWLVLAGLAVMSMVAAVLVARRQARLLSEPLESLSEISRRIASGDLSARAQPSPIPEVRRLAETHNMMVDRLTDLLERERAFSADASHQLRTPLTGLQLGLERALSQAEQPGFDPRPALMEASDQVSDLHHTIEDLLQLARARPGELASVNPVTLQSALAEADRLWHGPLAAQGRRLAVRFDSDLGSFPVPGGATAQILNVLLDNALRHGTGTVTITARGISEAVALDVSDEGSIAADPKTLFARQTLDGSGHGIGLPLAHSVAEACGGRLRLAADSPTTFSVLLPAPTDPVPRG